jgi:hypothetical protein
MNIKNRLKKGVLFSLLMIAFVAHAAAEEKTGTIRNMGKLVLVLPGRLLSLKLQ